MNENDFVTIPRYVIDTLRPKGYFQRFYALVGASSFSHVDAFETIETEREAYGLPNGYDNYQSFKRCKSYHVHNKLFLLR